MHPTITVNSLLEAATQLAKDDGISLDQFIATAVAEKVGLMRTLQVGLAPDSPLVAAVRRPYGSIAMG